jgi:hypothetical protein
MEQNFSMKISSLAKYAIGITTSAALLAACSSGGSSVNPAGTSLAPGASVHGLLTLAAHPASNVGVRPVSPMKKKKGGKAVQYISDFYGSDVLEFDYPKSTQSIGTITGVSDAQGECTMQTTGKAKKKKGGADFYVVASGSDAVEEFAAGGTNPITTLSESAGEPAGCGVDSKGDVAVSILGAGDVVIFKGGKGSGTTMSDGLSSTYFINYDSKGDLFVDGINGGGSFQLAELPAGGKSFENITVPNTVEFPGQVQWDGKYITVNDQEGYAIYQYTVTKTTAKLEGTVSYSGAGDCVQTWIAGSYFICPDASNADGKIYPYPKGGSPTATLTGSFELPIGSVALK